MNLDQIQIAIITSQFNSEITSKLYEGAFLRLKEHGLEDSNIHSFEVPGAVEIPLIAQRLAMAEQFHAIICLGAVIRGETSHYDYVCEQVSQGCQKIMLEFDIPVIFGVLTTEDEEQALARAGGEHGNKGHDAADTALHMIQLMADIEKHYY